MKKIIFLFSVVFLNFSFAGRAADGVYTVTSKVINTTYGTITPVDDEKAYNEGESITYTLTPVSGCELLKLSVNGEDKTSEVIDGKFTVTNISEDLTVIASFRPAGQKYFLTMSVLGGYPDNPPSAQNLPVTRAMFDPETKSCIYPITSDDYRKYIAVRVADTIVTLGSQPPEVTTAKWYIVGLNFCMVQPGVTKPGIYKFTYYWNDWVEPDTARYFINEEFLSLFPFTVNVNVAATGWKGNVYVHVKGDPDRTYKMQAKQAAGWYSYTFEGETDPLDIYFINEAGDYKSDELSQISSSGCYTIESDYSLTESECPPADIDEIGTADELIDKLTANTDPDAIFRLTADIDLGAWIDANSDNDVKTNGWKSLGTQSQPVTGTLDGAGFFLYDVWSNRQDNSSGGFIARAKALTIKNLGIKTKADKALTGNDNTGGFVCDFDSVQIENCCFNGVVRGGKQVGAFFGQTQTRGSSIKNSYAYGGVYGTDNVGGLWGKTMNANSSIEKSYSMVTVNGKDGQGSAAGIIASADMASAAATDIVASVKNAFLLNDTISGAWAAAAVCAYNRNAANVEVVNTVQLNAATTIIQGNTSRGSCVNATYTRTKQQVFDADTVFTNRNWDFNDIWQLGNADYPAPVLKNLTMAYQPSGAPEHLTGIRDLETDADVWMVYPNPTDGKLFIKPSVPVLVSVYDNAGRLIRTGITGSELDISGYPAGYYLLKIGNQFIKVVKK